MSLSIVILFLCSIRIGFCQDWDAIMSNQADSLRRIEYHLLVKVQTGMRA
jgi:hypothetical protein